VKRDNLDDAKDCDIMMNVVNRTNKAKNEHRPER
jgi:hypothetical protein